MKNKTYYILKPILLSMLFVMATCHIARSKQNNIVHNKPEISIDSFPIYPRVFVNNEWIIMLPEVFIWGGDPALADRKQAEWNRLRNAVFVTYPYARQAGFVMRDVQLHLKGITSKSERRKYIRSRERELKDAFGDKLSELSVYQGKVLMKLIHRQTGEDCYEIIKEMKGGITARVYQTILFFVGSDLKQSWEPNTDANDRLIESFVREMSQMYYPEDLIFNVNSGL